TQPHRLNRCVSGGLVDTPRSLTGSSAANNFYFGRVWRGSHITTARVLRIDTEKVPILASEGDMALRLATDLSPQFAERVDGVNGARTTDLSASTLEFVLKVQ